MQQEQEQDLAKVIGDFLEMGHVENIMAMFKQDTDNYSLTGELLRDERFMVRMGVAVLFEELKDIRPDDIALAIPSLVAVLTDDTPWVRGEAVNILGLIGTAEAMEHVQKMLHDPDPQVREIAEDYLQEEGN